MKWRFQFKINLHKTFIIRFLNFDYLNGDSIHRKSIANALMLQQVDDSRFMRLFSTRRIPEKRKTICEMFSASSEIHTSVGRRFKWMFIFTPPARHEIPWLRLENPRERNVDDDINYVGNKWIIHGNFIAFSRSKITRKPSRKINFRKKVVSTLLVVQLLQ